MGRRKLRFDVRKNSERKWKVERVDINPDLKISLPLSLFFSNTTSGGHNLCIRLERTIGASAKAIPGGWTLCSSQVDVTCTFTLSKLPFIVKVASDCTWVIVVGTDQIDRQYSQAFKDEVSKFSCVNDVIGLLEVMDNCTLCHGNQDTKFDAIREQYKGVFKDKSGLLLLNYCLGFTITCIVRIHCGVL